MLKNYLITTLRSFARNRVSTFINVAGLALGTACCIFVYVLVKHEYSFDNFHTKADRIYRVVQQRKAPEGMRFEGAICFPMASALRNDFPDLLTSAVYASNYALVKVHTSSGMPRLFEENEAVYADEYFLDVFDHTLLAGRRENLLNTPYEVILTRRSADKYFGKAYQNAYDQLIDQPITINKEEYRISGIVEDPPRNTNVPFSMLISFKSFEKQRPQWVKDWNSNFSSSFAFVVLPKDYPPMELEAQLPAFEEKYLTKELAKAITYLLQPLADIHTNETYGQTGYYDTPQVLMIAFILMAVIILATACINFINLATAQAVKRAKEIGIRKTLGSLKRQIMVQFMGETLLLTLLGIGIAIVLADVFLTAFNQYLSPFVELGLHMDISIILFLLLLALGVTLLAGYYPSHILARYRPTEALKQSFSNKNTGFAGKFSLRKTLIVLQFSISQLLLIGTIVVSLQMKYFREQDLGYSKEGVITVTMPGDEESKREILRNALTAQAAITNVTFNSGPPTSMSNAGTTFYGKEKGDTEKYGIERKYVDHHYLDVFGIQLLAGRNLRQEDKLLLTDSIHAYNALFNEKAIQIMGYEQPEEAIGQVAMIDGDEVTIVGVVANFYNISLHHEIQPCFLFYGTNWIAQAGVKMNMQNAKSTLAFIQETWQNLYPEEFYEFYFMDDYLYELYIVEDLMFQAFRIFAVLSIFIGCMGLYGLVSFLSLQRRKEIGIRKVLGASVVHIVYLFSKEFTLLVVLAFIIAAPLGYFAMKAWLETFANRIDLSLVYFIVALLASVGIAWLTVGYKSVRAAMSNPVESLKDE